DLARLRDDAFAQRESGREILEIGGRREHDDVRNAVIRERDGDFFGDAVGNALDPPVPPPLDEHFRARWCPERRIGELLLRFYHCEVTLRDAVVDAETKR